MNRKDMMFLAIALAVVALLYVLSISGKEPPLLPADEVHAGITDREQCKECHAPGKVKPMNPHHPFKEQCFNCHKPAKA